MEEIVDPLTTQEIADAVEQELHTDFLPVWNETGARVALMQFLHEHCSGDHSVVKVDASAPHSTDQKITVIFEKENEDGSLQHQYAIDVRVFVVDPKRFQAALEGKEYEIQYVYLGAHEATLSYFYLLGGSIYYSTVDPLRRDEEVINHCLSGDALNAGEVINASQHMVIPVPVSVDQTASTLAENQGSRLLEDLDSSTVSRGVFVQMSVKTRDEDGLFE